MGKVFTKIVVCELIALSAYASQEVTWKTPEQIQQDIDYALQARAFWDQKLTDFSVKLAMKRQALAVRAVYSADTHGKYACCVKRADESDNPPKCDKVTGEYAGTLPNKVYAGSKITSVKSTKDGDLYVIRAVRRRDWFENTAAPIWRDGKDTGETEDRTKTFPKLFEINFNQLPKAEFKLCVFPDGAGIHLASPRNFELDQRTLGVTVTDNK
mmetsp:Transcript_46963/g.75189  ORF Transcript_46963/g.75189 Transcript_46963/m.75189 type:complete len:213 (-) Transcript_46963:80-718(-)|eukprot:CAMPEP_0197028650 /NCGR_PEP_ID=MMETSP1384-20130603/8288_1 /TAXON_ID=29189 /ORGANISM="Ammonia sp." /LENGTH=212 /DNA_ID=CAMNT_0042457681 /DNA_START=105 /DNA_END=743 /DNA_ORIENTATION=-